MRSRGAPWTAFGVGPEAVSPNRCHRPTVQTQRTVPADATPASPVSAPIRVATDDYRAALARSVEAARRHDQLLVRLHAVEAARALLRLLFRLEGRDVPSIDGVARALPSIEAAQDWPAGYLRWALVELLRDPIPRRQVELARRVERLLASRGLLTSAIVDPVIDRASDRPPRWRLSDRRHFRAGPDARSVLE